MKRVLVAALLLAGYCAAQTPSAEPAPFGKSGDTAAKTSVTEQLVPVSRSDIYCSGYLSKDPVPRSNFVAGGVGTPDSVRFMERDLIYLKGSYQPGAMVGIVRQWKNPDQADLYKGVSKMLKEAGQPYLDMGYARILEQRGEMTVARVEFNCDAIVIGDLAVPFVERPAVSVRQRTTMDRFPVKTDGLAGRIIMSRDGDQVTSVGRKVFLNLGSEKGVKPGDYFRITRGYSKDELDDADAATLGATILDDTQKDPQRIPVNKLNQLPSRLIGEVVVLNATPTSSTAMVTFMMEEMHAGDAIEREAAQ